jgi:hypothetical protein
MYIKITKNAKGQTYYHLVESYRYNGKVKQRTLMSLGKADDNCIPINDVKGIKFGISDTCKNWEKENLGKDRYKRECSEGNEGIEYEDTTQDFKN